MALSRRVFLAGLSATGLVPLARPNPGAEPEEAEEETEPMTTEAHLLTPVPIERVVIDDAFWSPKRKVWQDVTVHDCFQKFEAHQSGVLNNFDRVRDGLKGGHAGLPWFDGLIYEMIRGAADFLRSHPDPELEAKLDGAIDRIAAAAAQDPGGYVNTYTQLEEPGHRWGLNGGLEVWQHEFYNLGALVEAGVHYCRATGKTKLLEAAVRIANTMADLVGPAPKKNLVPSHELPEEAMLGLYRLLQERPELKAKLSVPADAPRYLALAEFWIENRGRHAGKPDWEPDRGKAEAFVRQYDDYANGRPSWGAYAQDHVPVLAQEEIVGHAVRATLLASAVAATACVNGRDDYRQTALRLWESMTLRRMHVTGGVGAYAQEEKFGPDYALPNDAYLETCAAVGAGFFHHHMNVLFGHARYADELERVLYNGVLCGVSLPGNKYTYQNPLVADERRERWSWHDCPCCPPMFLKIMGALPGYVYATDADSAYVNLFVGGHGAMTVKGTDLVLRQTTRYPWDGAVRIDVEPAARTEFGLMVRVPAWCRGATVRVNGQRVETGKRVRGYVRIERAWQKGDVVELNLPMPVQAVRAHPKVTENLGRVALMRGPLVYCVESVDNVGLPAAPTLAARSEFATETWKDQLGGVVAIQAWAVEEPSPAWGESLYAPAPKRAGKRRRMVAIPFYANANRGPATMTVWIPREA
jgi:DUF1680 family protein